MKISHYLRKFESLEEYMTKESVYPELEKMKSVRGKSQALGEFLDWLREEKSVCLAKPHRHSGSCRDPEESFLVCGVEDGELLPFHYSMERLLAEFFGIDLRKVEAERTAIVQAINKGFSEIQGGGNDN